MNDRSTAVLLIAVALAGYGVYVAGYVPAMLVGQPVPVLLLGFVLQAVCALAALSLDNRRGNLRVSRVTDPGAFVTANAVPLPVEVRA
jgi:hypothetical protein